MTHRYAAEAERQRAASAATAAERAQKYPEAQKAWDAYNHAPSYVMPEMFIVGFNLGLDGRESSALAEHLFI